MLWTCVMRNKSLQADSAKSSHIQKQTQIFYNREKNNLSVNNIHSLDTKKHKCYNSGFETNLLNCKTCECGSFWEEALRQSYDLWLQWRERESQRKREQARERERGQIQLTAFVNMWGGVEGWERWKWITTLWKIRFLPIISEWNYKRRTENQFPQQASSLWLCKFRGSLHVSITFYPLFFLTIARKFLLFLMTTLSIFMFYENMSLKCL